MSILLRHHLRCQYSGLPIGTLEVATVNGFLPYLSHWDNMIARHPVFSLDAHKLLKYSKSEWDRLARKLDDAEISVDEASILQVCYLALLHSLDCIRQDQPALPPLRVVQGTMNKLFALAYWKYYLESKRFRFPTYHLSRVNSNLEFQDIGHYLDLCFDVRRDYETKVHEAVELEKIRQAERALVALNSSWITPVGKKTLWTWVKAHLKDTQYANDCEGWLSTLFLGGSAAIVDFDEEDIELAEEIIVSNCPAGTGVMHAVRQRLDVVRRTWDQYNKAFEIDLGDFGENRGLFVNGEQVQAPEPGPEPKASDFPVRAKFLIAHAKWTIAKQAFEKGQKGKDNGNQSV